MEIIPASWSQVSDMGKFSVSGGPSEYKLKSYLFPGNDEVENITGLPFTLENRLLQKA